MQLLFIKMTCPTVQNGALMPLPETIWVTFGYDYSLDDIPEAPNMLPGPTTTGVKLEANLSSFAATVLTIYPVGQFFAGNYTLQFDAWSNYDVDERINGGFEATTEF